MRDSKQHRRKRLEAVQSDLLDRQVPDQATAKSDRIPTEAERQALVERRIQEAMAEGAFDHLPGKGKPLKLNRNPYLVPGQDLAFGLLKNNGLAPEWIERDKEIRQELEAARQELRLARSRRQAGLAGDTTWQAALAHFEVRLAKLNRKIDDFNLIVPVVSKQRLRLRLASELRRLEKETE
jgi:DnaJ family protein C protein 28